MSRPPLLALRDVKRDYGGRWHLDLPELEVAVGELLTIVGPTGAGKSTLLRLMHLLEAPRLGEILFDGRPIEGRATLAERRSIAMVFQRPLMLSGTVRHNLGVALRLRRQPAADRTEVLLREFDLEPLADRHAASLSGGEMQRVALARAVACRPRLLLLDEPAANLDPGHVALIEGIIRRLQSRDGTTIVLATHQLDQARRLAGRVGLLAGGRLIEIGPSRDFFERPSQPLTAAYLRGELLVEELPQR